MTNEPKIYITEESQVTLRGPCSDELPYTNMIVTDETDGVITLTHAMTSDELKTAFAALPPMDPVEPAHTWKFWAWDLRQNVAKNDPEDFLNWPGIVGTMFVGNAPYIEYELEALTREFWAYKCAKVLAEPRVGNPDTLSRKLRAKGSQICDVKLTTSGNLVHQTYHIWQWEQKTGRRIKDLDTIVEIGGGYGAMALICYRLGFRGRYIILDLPEFSLLQQYYLSNVGVEGIEFKTQIDKQIESDLLIGLFSLSEMSLHARNTIIDLCPTQSYLVAYGANWGGWDNRQWAMDLIKRRQRNVAIWQMWTIEHLPNCWYLVGYKRE